MAKVTLVQEETAPREVESLGLGQANVTKSVGTGDDPFSQPASDIRALNGLTPVTKRRITRELQKYHRGVDGTQSKKIEYQEITGYNAFEVMTPPYNLDYLAKLYDISSPHHSAVDAKTSNIVGLGYTFVETVKTKRALENASGDQEKLARSRRKLERAKEDLGAILDAMHEEDTFTETLIKVWTDFECTGNGYIEVVRNRAGRIGYIGHIPSTTVRVRRDRDGFVQIISNKAVFFRNFGDRKTVDPIGGDRNPAELIHIKKYAPSSAYYGIPDVVSAIQAITGNEFASRFNLDYFENKAVPRHVIILKGATLGSVAERQLMAFFETGLKGQNHRTLYIPLPGDSPDEKVDLKIEPVEAGVQDSSFNNYLKSNLMQILMAHRTPITKTGFAEGLNLAAARDMDKTFKEQVCQPRQDVFEKKLNRIISEFTDALELKLNEMTLTDADTQSKIDERYLKTGVLLRNEVRANQGRGGIPKGDEIIDINKPEERTQRERDSQRSAGATDSAGEARNPKGDGRTSP